MIYKILGIIRHTGHPTYIVSYFKFYYKEIISIHKKYFVNIC